MRSIFYQVFQTTVFVIVLCLALFVVTQRVSAQVGIPGTGVDLDGYAWSDTIGWISMNCSTGGTTGNNVCSTSNYKVRMSNTGALTGYAWSSTVGWVRFGGLNSFPVISGSVAANASVTGTYPNLTFRGWARACAGTLGGTCSSMTDSSISGGWDGWISLRKTGTYPYYILMSATGARTPSYAWGGTVTGWIDFDRIVYIAPTATISGTGCTNIRVGESTCVGNVTWNITNASSPNIINSTIGGAASYSVPSGTNQIITLRAGAVGNVIHAQDGSVSLSSTNLSATCVTGADFRNNTTCELLPVPAPLVTISTNKKIARVGEIVNVAWTIEPPTPGISCTLTGPGFAGTRSVSDNQDSNPLRSKTRFTINCTGAFVPTPVSTSTEVEIIPVAAEV
jgi:hypothetical protein